MSQPWDAPPAPDDDGFFEELAEGLTERDRHRPHRSSGHHGTGMDLRTQVRGQYGRGVSVGDVLSFLDFRVNELYAALLEPERHASRVPGSPVRMAGIDAVLNADAAAFRSLTELGARLDRVEAKLDALLERLPER